MKEQKFNGKDSISVIYSLTKFKRACHSSPISKDAAVWLFQIFMTGPAFAGIKARFTLSHNDAKKHEGTITSYDRVMSYMVRWYGTDSVVTNDKENFRNYEQGLLAP